MTNSLSSFKNHNHSLVFFIVIVLFSCSPVKESADPRIAFCINDNWEFITDEITGKQILWNTENDNNTEAISLPHTWNKNDLLDSISYLRAKFQYNKNLSISDSLIGKRLFLHFEGVNQIADIFLNSTFVYKHKGGYTGFTVEITDYIISGKQTQNTLSVVVDNRFNKNIPPLSADFNFFGGIYRNVWLIATNSIHFSFTDFGSKGIYISTPKVSDTEAVVNVRGLIQNQSDSKKDIIVVNSVRDKDSKEVCRFETPMCIMAHEEIEFTYLTT